MHKTQLTSMKRIILAILCFFLVQGVMAQVKPDFFPEDVSQEGVEVRCFCTPGVRNKSRAKGINLSYQFIGGGTFTEEDNTLAAPYTDYDRWEQWEFDIKAPVWNKEHLKILLGYKYAFEVFHIGRLGADFPETFGALDQASLKSSSLSAIVTKPLNEEHYLAFRLRYTANGNYSGLMDFDGRFAVYKGLAVFGLKPTEDFEWGFGLNVSKSFRRTSILPFLLYNRNFNTHWGIESAFPGYVYGRYNVGPRSILLFGAEYGSDSYRLGVTLPNDELLDYALNHSEVLCMVRFEQQIAPWVWGNLKLGYQMNFSTNFESKSLNTPGFNVEPTNAFFVHVGLFLSPPDSLME